MRTHTRTYFISEETDVSKVEHSISGLGDVTITIGDTGDVERIVVSRDRAARFLRNARTLNRSIRRVS